MPFVALGAGNGLYRLHRHSDSTLVYIGQGRVADRLVAHLRKGTAHGHAQQKFVSDPNSFEVSWMLSTCWMDHHRLELENDLIAAHMLTFGVPPLAQFQG